MKIIIFLSFIFICVNTVAAQKTCDKNEVLAMINEKTALSRAMEKKMEQQLEQQVSELAIKKNWDDKEKAQYLIKLVSSEYFSKSIAEKQDIIVHLMSLLQQVDGNNASAQNCKLADAAASKIDEVMSKTKKEWDMVIDQVTIDYALVISGNDTEVTAEQKITNNPKNPEKFIGLWFNKDKKETFYFLQNGVVTHQILNKDAEFDQSLWSIENQELCFNSAANREKSICIPFTIKDGILHFTLEGEDANFEKIQ
ncbi:hypothetical protein [Aquimarina brevivitae]|uniref:Uncharacterized protein n=1 Tax=Aquimarina brevivitae TaxID=323412 RepID=A0A4Q7P353_9FLAO|nr:hypothetical protein [Aquimarina brevivitae]RZS93798.1 hypothetical protein EV197_2379 [Aquimarina brevivitae]